MVKVTPQFWWTDLKVCVKHFHNRICFLSLFNTIKKPRNGLLARKVYRHNLTLHSPTWNKQPDPVKDVTAHGREVELDDL